MIRFLTLFLLAGSLSLQGMAQSGTVRSWTYVQRDDQKAKWGDWEAPDWLRYVGLDAGDVDGDGDLDVLGKPYSWNAPLLNIWLQDDK